MKPNTPIFWAKDFFRPLLVDFLFLSNGDGGGVAQKKDQRR